MKPILASPALNLLFLLTVSVWPFHADAAEAVALKSIATIPLADVKGRFDHFSIDPKGQRLFVAALGNNTIEVIDLAAGKRSASISGMSKPQGVLFLPDRNELLVANGDEGNLRILDGTDFKVKHSLPNLPDADNVRLDPHSGVAWVGYGDGGLAGVLAGGNKASASIKLSGHPESFQLETHGSRIFVNVPDARQITVVNATKHSTVAEWPMKQFQANFPMALDESNQRLFVGCRKPARLVILDTRTGKSVDDLEISADTDDLFYDAKRKRIYISCGEGSINIVSQNSADSYSLLAKVQTSSGARTCFFSPEVDRLYLAVPARGSQKAEIRVFEPQ